MGHALHVASSEAGRAFRPSVVATAESRALVSLMRVHAYEGGTGERRAAFRDCGSFGRNRKRRACRQSRASRHGRPASRRDHGTEAPAFAPRRVRTTACDWSGDEPRIHPATDLERARSLAPSCSPPAGKPETEGAHPLGDERRAGGRPAPRRTATADQQARSYRAGRRPDVAEITGAGREWTVSMISELSIPWR